MRDGVYSRDPDLGLVPAVPCPFYVWTRLWWQKVRCQCGREFISRDRGLMPPEYQNHYVLTHVEPIDVREEQGYAEDYDEAQ